MPVNYEIPEVRSITALMDKGYSDAQIALELDLPTLYVEAITAEYANDLAEDYYDSLDWDELSDGDDFVDGGYWGAL